MFSEGFLLGCTGLQARCQAQEEPEEKYATSLAGGRTFAVTSVTQSHGAGDHTTPPQNDFLGVYSAPFLEGRGGKEERDGSSSVGRRRWTPPPPPVDTHISLHPIDQWHRKCVHILHSGAVVHFLAPQRKISTSMLFQPHSRPFSSAGPVSPRHTHGMDNAGSRLYPFTPFFLSPTAGSACAPLSRPPCSLAT